jgi:hypothetical protein
VDSQVFVPSIENSTNSKPLVRRPKSQSKRNPYTNAWRLVDSEFDSLNALFSFTLEVCRDPDKFNKHGLLPFYSEKDSFRTRDIARESVYCDPPRSLALQCVEHIRTCNAKSPKKIKLLLFS